MRIARSAWSGLCFCSLALFAFSLPLTAAPIYQFRQLAEEGQSIGDQRFESFNFSPAYAPALNDAGQVAFSGVSRGTDGQPRYGIFTQDRLLVGEGHLLPDGTSVYANPNDIPSLNNAGEVAFGGAALIDGQYVNGVFTQNRVVALPGQTVGGVTLTSANAIGRNTPINDAGLVAFFGQGSSASGVMTTEGLVLGQGQTLTGGSVSFNFSELEADLNNAGQVAVGGVNIGGIFGDSVVVASGTQPRTYQVIPSYEAGIGGLSLNNAGQVAWRSGEGSNVGRSINTPRGTIAIGDTIDGRTLIEFVDESGESTFYDGLGKPSLNDAGLVAFTSYFDNQQFGIFTQEGLVAQRGQLVNGGSDRLNIASQPLSLNNSGDIAFWGSLGDRRFGIILAERIDANEVPEPNTTALLGAGLLCVIALRMRRKLVRAKA